MDTKIFSQNYMRQQSPFSLSDHFYWCTWIAERHLHYKVLKTLAPLRLIDVHVNVHSKGDNHPGECQTRKYTCKQISSLLHVFKLRKHCWWVWFSLPKDDVQIFLQFNFFFYFFPNDAKPSSAALNIKILPRIFNSRKIALFTEITQWASAWNSFGVMHNQSLIKTAHQVGW